MGTDLPGALIRLILFSGFAADIAGQLSLAVFVGGLVEIPGGTDDHELDCIQKSGFSSAVFTGQRVESPKSMVQLLNLCQLISFILVSFFIAYVLSLSVCFQFLKCSFNVFHAYSHQDGIIDQNP